MARRRKGSTLTPEQALTAILEALKASDPLRLNKTMLLEMRHKALAFAAAGLGRPHEEVLFVPPDPEYIEAVRVVAGYEGTSEFMVSLRAGLETYGGLTARQAEAVLMPPNQWDIENMVAAGVDESRIKYRFEAIDALQEAKRRGRKKQDAEAQE